MSAERLTPKDDLVGLPLPILPNITDLDLNRHHSWHPRHDPMLQSIGGKALRLSRIQLIDRKRHAAYHQQFDGPEIPADEREQLRLVLLACAGFVPEHGLDVSSDEPKVVMLSSSQRRLFRAVSQSRQGRCSALCYLYDDTAMRRFLTEYVIAQQAPGINNATIDEFLYTHSQDRRYELGKLLISDMVDAAAVSVEPHYSQARSAGLLNPTAPPETREFMLGALRQPGWLSRIVPVLQVRFAPPTA